MKTPIKTPGKTFTRVLLSAAIVICLGSAASASFAQDRWERDHPRIEQIRDRLDHEDARIDRHFDEHRLSPHEARHLHREIEDIRRDGRHMAERHGGHLDPREADMLNRRIDFVDHKIDS